MQRTVCLTTVAVVLCTMASPSLAEHERIMRRNIPEKVLKGFEAAYPGEKVREASKEEKGSQNVYKLEYSKGKTEYDVVFAEDGTIVGTDEGIPVGDLPAAVVRGCKAAFPNGVIREAEKITRGAEVTYGVDLKTKGDRTDAIFSAEGKLIKKWESENDEADDDEGETDDD